MINFSKIEADAIEAGLAAKLKIADEHIQAAINALDDNCADDARKILETVYDRWLAIAMNGSCATAGQPRRPATAE